MNALYTIMVWRSDPITVMVRRKRKQLNVLHSVLSVIVGVGQVQDLGFVPLQAGTSSLCFVVDLKPSFHVEAAINHWWCSVVIIVNRRMVVVNLVACIVVVGCWDCGGGGFIHGRDRGG
eukprot:scaffold102958_cov58-Attheya_sp.AAC.1